MATASELLGGNVLSIDVNSRTINIPSAIKNLGVESDDEVQKLTFSIPQYYNGVDFSTFNIRINYTNARGGEDVGHVTDIRIEDETIYFTWVVERFAFMFPGAVEFVVCLREIDGEGVVLREFNTTTASLPVLKGKETSDAAVEVNYDAIAVAVDESIQRAIDSELKGEPGYTPVKGTDYYTEEEQQQFSQMVVDNANGQFASAVKGKVSGEVIRVDDVCPIEHLVSGMVRGKNLWDMSKIASTNNVTNNGDGSLTIAAGVYYSSTGKKISEVCPRLRVGDTVTFSMVTDGKQYIYLNLHGAIVQHNETLMVTENFLNSSIAVYGVADTDEGYENEHTITSIQLELGTEATEYTPYVDPSMITLTRCGKNLWDGSISSVTKYWVESTKQSGYFEVPIRVGKGNTVAVSYPESVAPGQGFYTGIASSVDSSIDKWLYHSTEESLITNSLVFVSESEFIYLRTTGVSSGMFAYHIGNKLQIEISDVVTDYESYKGATYTPATDGTVDIVSVSPTMTIFTDTPGAIIEAEYSRDTTKMFESYVVTDEMKQEIADMVTDDFEAILDELHTYAQSVIGGES